MVVSVEDLLSETLTIKTECRTLHSIGYPSLRAYSNDAARARPFRPSARCGMMCLLVQWPFISRSAAWGPNAIAAVLPTAKILMAFLMLPVSFSSFSAAMAVKMPTPATRHTKRAWFVGRGWSKFSSMKKSGTNMNCAAMTPQAPRPRFRACDSGKEFATCEIENFNNREEDRIRETSGQVPAWL